MINLGKKEVMFVPKKLFIQKSKMPKKKNKVPIIREVLLLIWILDFGKSRFFEFIIFPLLLFFGYTNSLVMKLLY